MLSERLEAAASGRGQVVFVAGEGGIGKTRFMAETVTLAADYEFEVFQGRGEELEATRPFGAVADALGCSRRAADATRAAIGRLITGEVSEGDEPVSTDPGLRYQVVEALVELVEDLAAARPVMLVLEDLHWADPSTLLAVRVLGRRLRYASVALIGTFRPTRDRKDLERLVDVCVEEGNLHLRLGPLDEPAVTDLATDVIGASPGPRLARQLSRAGGNPLFVLELLGALREQGAVTMSDGCAEVGEVGLPATARQAILRRLGSVSDETVELLRLASILGSTLSLADLAIVCRQPVVELLPAIVEAFRAGLIGEAGDQLAFCHDLVREVVYHDLPHAVRVGLHREAGLALAAAGAPASRVAVHLGIGATPGDAQAVSWLCRAAREVFPRAPGVAADFFGQAAELMHVGDPERHGVVAEQIYGLLWAGRIGEGHALARQLLRGGLSSAAEISLRNALGWALAMRGNVQEAVAVCDIDPVALALSERETVQLQAIGVLARAYRGDMDGARVAASVQARADQLGDGKAWSIASSALSIAALSEGRLADAITTASAVMKRVAGSPLSEMQQMVCCNVLAHSLARADRLEEAAEVLDESWRTSRERGSVWNLPLLHYAEGVRCFLAGDWDEAVTTTETGLAIAGEIGTFVIVVSAHGILSLLAVHRGQPAVAEHHLEVAETHLSRAELRTGTFWTTWATFARGMAHDMAKRPDEALDWLERSWAQAAAVGTVTAYPLIGPDLVRLAMTAGQVGRAQAVTGAVEAAAALMDSPSATAAALWCRGLTGPHLDILLEAVTRYQHAPRPFERARACEDTAVTLSRVGRSDEARPLFDEALALYDKLGAVPHTARAIQALRDLGLERRKRRRRAHSRVGWDALTDKELAVVDLVTQGLTNFEIGRRLFISHHTVATHLTHIFGKLGVTSKVELAAQAARRFPTS